MFIAVLALAVLALKSGAIGREAGGAEHDEDDLERAEVDERAHAGVLERARLGLSGFGRDLADDEAGGVAAVVSGRQHPLAGDGGDRAFEVFEARRVSLGFAGADRDAAGAAGLEHDVDGAARVGDEQHFGPVAAEAADLADDAAGRDDRCAFAEARGVVDVDLEAHHAKERAVAAGDDARGLEAEVFAVVGEVDEPAEALVLGDQIGGSGGLLLQVAQASAQGRVLFAHAAQGEVVLPQRVDRAAGDREAHLDRRGDRDDDAADRSRVGAAAVEEEED
jgi:hypothetical protein